MKTSRKAFDLSATAAPDGMLFDQNGNLYFCRFVENNKNPSKPDGSIHTL
jgi:sugar lactone lactonase YvrE